jgi:hypothetical protein
MSSVIWVQSPSSTAKAGGKSEDPDQLYGSGKCLEYSRSLSPQEDP